MCYSEEKIDDDFLYPLFIRVPAQGGGVNGMEADNGNKKWIKNKKEVSKNMVSGIALKE